ncbi:MAG: hypothetical protein R3B13_17765 [Polyangiaceae bacterium]
MGVGMRVFGLGFVVCALQLACSSDTEREFSNGSGGAAGAGATASGGAAGSATGGTGTGAAAGAGGAGAAASGGAGGTGGVSGSGGGGTGGTPGTGGAAPTPTVVAPAVWAQDIVEQGGTLYWTEAGTNPGYKDSKVRQWTAGGGAADLTTTPDGRFMQLALSGSKLYWTNQGAGGGSGTVEVFDLSSSSSPQKSLATNVDMATGLARDGGKVYFTVFSTDGSVKQIDGTTVTTPFPTQSQPNAIAAVTGKLFWGNYNQPGALMSGTPGGSPSPLAALDYVTAVASNGTDLYVAHDGGISKLNLVGVGGVILPDKNVTALHLTATHVYWTSAAQNLVGRAKLDGSERTELVKNAPSEPRGLTSSSTSLYWTEYGSLGRIMRLDLP